MRRFIFTCLFNLSVVLAFCATTIHIANPQNWSSSSLSSYVGQTVSFDVPMYMLQQSGSYLSPCCTGVAYGSSNVVYISGAPRTSRSRTFSTDLQAKVDYSDGTCSLRYVSGSFYGNTRDALLQGPDSAQIDAKGKHTLLVCAANLEYYLAINFGTGFGPDNQKQHDAQRTKTKQALALINADIYGLCEIEQGTAALQEICYDLNTAHPNRRYTYVDNHTSSAAGSYTMSAFVYDSLVVMPYGSYKVIDTEVKNRKYMQCFKEKATDEKFIFSMNHFKAMSGGGDTESRRIAEANAINSTYVDYKRYCEEEDLLIMGDLNCHYGDAPITILLNDSRTDLHRYFHPEGSYSYLYGGSANYLDHAISNLTLLPQVTGMLAYHVNSDEDDCYTYDGRCNDGTMFRYSDHDPVLVGLRLDSTQSINNKLDIVNYGNSLQVHYGEGGYVRIYDMSGNLLNEEPLAWEEYSFTLPETYHGCFIVHVYHDGINHVTKYIRP